MRLSFVAAVGLLSGLITACPPPAPEGSEAASNHSPQASAPASAPGSMPGAAPHALPPSGDPISGTITLAEGVDGSLVGPTDALYIMARTSQGGGLAGRLVAVKRMSGLEAGKLPTRFELSQSDIMVAGMPFLGPFILYARLDKDGDPMTKTDQDLYATVPEPVTNGQKDLKLLLKPGKPKTLSAPKAPGSAPAAQPSGH